jgi:hypothetical protein
MGVTHENLTTSVQGSGEYHEKRWNVVISDEGKSSRSCKNGSHALTSSSGAYALIHAAANFASFFLFRRPSINESTFWRIDW